MLSRRYDALCFLGLSTLLGLNSCVGSAESRRGGPEAAYAGPVIRFEGEAAPVVSGRVAPGKEDSIRMAWPGTTATVRFRGTAVSAELTDNGKNHYLVLVDGKPMREKITPVAGRSTIELVKGLSRGEHTVSLYRLNEPLVGTSTLHGFVLDKYGEPLPAKTNQRARIEIIGDSISTGYGNEGQDETCGFSPETQNHFLTYGARAARAVGAELTTLAWSGKGVFSNRGSAESPTMSQLWAKTLPEEDVAYEFNEAPPQVVLINLGTNDFAPEVEDTTPFQAAYEKLLSDVRTRYPKAQLFVALGPLLTDTYPEGKKALSTVRGILTSLVEKHQEAGDERTHFLEFAGATEAEGRGCDWHPSEKTHRRMAATWVKALKEKAGF